MALPLKVEDGKFRFKNNKNKSFLAKVVLEEKDVENAGNVSNCKGLTVHTRC